MIKNHPAMFNEIYQPRFVNNIYFDTIDLTNYNDNVNGKSERLKVRIRWYGDLLGNIVNPVLELKYKKAYTGTKVKYMLNPFRLNDVYSHELQQEMFEESDIPLVLKDYLKSMRPYMLNRYYRKYFQSSDHKFTVTPIDSMLEFYRVMASNNNFLYKCIDQGSVIVELKYPETNEDVAESIGVSLPFRLTKSSKYIQGMDLLYG